MIILISPAKTLDFDSPAPTGDFTQPAYLKQSQQLINILKKLSHTELASLMKLSDKLAALNAGRYVKWSLPFTRKNAKQAVFIFQGDVYKTLDAQSLNQQQLHFAQQHLRILSGLYGLLRPLDLIQPYRLEMGTGLKNKKGKDLYAFWGDLMTDQLNVETNGQPVINLASNEYFSAINSKLIRSTIITPVFKELKNGTYKIISFNAKKARGLMSRYIIEKKILNPDDLLHFNCAGYRYNASMSEKNMPVFIRS